MSAVASEQFRDLIGRFAMRAALAENCGRRSFRSGQEAGAT